MTYTYFIYSPLFGMVKIGKSFNPESRFVSLRTASPDPELRLIGTVKGDIEGNLHMQFRHSRSHGEWFILTDDLADWLKKRIRFTADASDWKSQQKLIVRHGDPNTQMILACVGSRVTSRPTDCDDIVIWNWIGGIANQVVRDSEQFNSDDRPDEWDDDFSRFGYMIERQWDNCVGYSVNESVLTLVFGMPTSKVRLREMIATTSETSLCDVDVVPGATYYYSVRSINDCTASNCTDPVRGSTIDTPAAPVLTNPDNGSSAIGVQTCLTWFVVNGATSYDLYWGTTNPPPLHVSGIPAVTYCPPHESGSMYYWYVQAANACGEGQASPTWHYSTAAGISIVGFESCRDHGQSVGEACLNIPDDGSFIESRLGGIERIRVRFSGAVDPNSWDQSSVVILRLDQFGQSIDLSNVSISLDLIDANATGVIEFNPSLPDHARYCVAIQSVVGADGGPLDGDRDRILAALAGDCLADGSVTNADLAYVRVRRGIDPIDDQSNDEIRADILTDGRITNADLAAARVRRGNSINSIPDPCAGIRSALSDRTSAEPESSAAETRRHHSRHDDCSAAAADRPTVVEGMPAANSLTMFRHQSNGYMLLVDLSP